MKRSGFTLWKWLASGAGLFLVAAIFLPVFARSRGSDGQRVRCPNNLKQISLGLLQYSQDFDEKLPMIAFSSTSNALDSKIPNEKKRFFGWADVLYPYTKNTQIFQCPLEANDSSNALPTARGYTDYWFNANLSGFAMKNAKAPAKIIAFGDGNDRDDLTDARYNLFSLPAAWIADQNSPAYRHIVGANYAFLDGHVKWLKPDQVGSGAATFASK